MSQFHYRAVTSQGQMQQGQLDADSREQVVAQLQQAGLIVLEIRKAGRWELRLGSQRLAGNLVLLFTQQMAALLAAGIALDRALEIMTQLGQEPRLTRLIGNIHQGLRGGKALSAVLAEQQGFSDFYLSLIRAAEAAGNLGQGLEDLAFYQERAQALKDKTLSAFLYPLVLLLVSALSLLVILTYVVPQFQQLFSDMGKALPLPTQVVIASAGFIRDWGLWLLLALALGGVLLQRQLKEPVFRLRWDSWLLRLPLYGTLLGKLEMARFSRSLGTLLKSGVPLVKALQVARTSVGNSRLGKALDDSTEGLKEGQRLAGLLKQQQVFPALALQMLQVGEETGQLDQMLLKVAGTYDREVETGIQRLLTVLEPLLIVGLGMLIAAIIISILMAILSINDLPL
ncbi:MAG: type II secretion system F family protein [Pseudomonadota bacterium]|uniref:type II secretion system F family protein n=1 Tax=Gallaecimonas pentaromativorans TaxID=584787 RepID=UPI00067E8844|nr:type II secretion system F family protein [Gallaecimonas pentaromativorans]MED5526795.1 type II secretion system F family protein [Pseudomonadota bacterium]